MLDNKQKKYLKSLANGLNAIFQVGKDGVSKNQIIGIKDALEAHELVKISILKTCLSPVREVALDIASATRSEIIQVIGRTIVLYKESKKKIIELPKSKK